MTKKNRKSSRSQRLSHLKIKSNTLPTKLPASVHSPPNQNENQDREENLLIHSIDIHLTVRAKIKMTGKQACMLAGIAIESVLAEGISMKDWIVLEFLYNFLLNKQTSPAEVKESRSMEILYCLKIILLSGTWMGLEKRNRLPEDIELIIKMSRFIPNQRTISSWTQNWNLETFIEVRAVPMNTFLKRSTGTQRYSGYCKGYGESGPAGNCKKTKHSSELDGEEPREMEQKIDLLSIGTLLQLILTEERLQNNRTVKNKL
jgi:hypothetical protein